MSKPNLKSLQAIIDADEDERLQTTAYVNGKYPDTWEDDFKYSTDFIELLPSEEGVFHVKKAEEFVKTVQCRSCTSVEFNVGRGPYFTAIKCKQCGWEAPIHEG